MNQDKNGEADGMNLEVDSKDEVVQGICVSTAGDRSCCVLIFFNFFSAYVDFSQTCPLH